MDSTARARHKPGLLVEAFDDELVVLDPGTGDLHHLNCHASLVWSFLDRSGDASEVTELVAQQVGLEPAVIAQDVHAAIRLLQDSGLLVPDDSPPGMTR